MAIKKLTTNQELRQLKEKHKLTNAQLAKVLDRSISTVEHWLANEDSVSFRNAPKDTIELLKYKLTEIE